MQSLSPRESFDRLADRLIVECRLAQNATANGYPLAFSSVLEAFNALQRSAEALDASEWSAVRELIGAAE